MSRSDGGSQHAGNSSLAASARVWRTAPPGTKEWLEHDVPNSDLRTLLLAMAAERAERVQPSDLISAWRRDAFVRPAASDPRRLAVIEAELWAMLPADFDGVELSPTTPLGSVTATTALSENRVVSTTRLTEVVSDSTNVLAIEASARRLSGTRGPVDLAASHRQLRAQRFGPGTSQHFRLFALVSSARDIGSGRTEASLLLRHLSYWSAVLAALVPARSPTIELSVWDDGPVAERVADTVRPALGVGTVPLVDDPARSRGRGYYTGVALRLAADDGSVELGDGGLTTWTARLTGNRKERCLVSCIATERLAGLLAA